MCQESRAPLTRVQGPRDEPEHVLGELEDLPLAALPAAHRGWRTKRSA